MRISETAIQKPRLVLLSAMLICILGYAAILTLPRERTPRVKLPVIVVAIPNPGASPSINESQIIHNVEDEIDQSLDNLRDSGSVISEAVNGAAIIQFIFDEFIDVAEAKRDVESLINRVKGQFPEDAQQDPGPTVNDIAFEDWPIIQVFVAGGADGWHRRNVAEYLEKQIESISGVAGVDIFGGLEREIQIELDPHLMVLYGFSYQEVESAIRRANAETPSGAIESASGNENRVRTLGKLDSLEDIQQIPLGTREGRPVALGDIAKVSLGRKPIKSLARYGGRDAVVLLARAKTDVDVMGTAEKVRMLVDEFMASGGAGEDTYLGTIRSQAREIGYMIQLLTNSAVYGLILVVLILWVAFGWRNAGLIALAVPFSILGTGAIMWFTKRSITPDLAITNMLMFGMILVVGMVVDGCIIVGENIYRHRELGRSPVQAATRGIAEVGASLVSAYMTTFAAFAPMFMVRGTMGDFMEVLPQVVLFALCAAMLVDHFLLPVLSVYIMKVPSHELAKAQRIRRLQENATPAESEVIAAESKASESRILRAYSRAVEYALGHRLVILVMAIVLSITPVALFYVGAIGFEFFPDSDLAQVEVHFELPLGSSMEKRTAEVAAQIEQAVMRAVRPDEWYRPSPTSSRVKPVTTIGEPGALSIRLDSENTAGPEFGMVYAELELAENRHRTVAQIRQAITDELPPLPGVIVRVRSPKEGPPAGAPVMVRVLARPDAPITIEDLSERADHIMDLIRAVPGTFDVSSDYRLRPEVSVTPNRTVASLYDIDAAQIATSVNYALDGVKVGEVDFGTAEQFDLRLRNRLGDRDQIEDLSNLPLRSPSGKVVSLNQVADIQRARSANVIRRYDRQRVVNVRAQLEEGILADDTKVALVAGLRPDLTKTQQHDLVIDRNNRTIYADENISIEFGGENQVRDEALEDLKIAMLVAVAAMMIILTVKFNSFIQPLIILFSVPLSLVGVTIGMMLCGFYFSISAMIGVVALAGIVVNDAIVLVDFINRLRDAGVPMKKAVVYAGQMRLRPIILTTITTIGGLLPLGLNIAGGGEFFQPLTVAIMFGLGFATLLQLFIIPLACYTFDFRSSALDPAAGEQASDPPPPGPAATTETHASTESPAPTTAVL